MHVIPFEPGHLERLALQPHQRAWLGRIGRGRARRLAAGGQAWTAIGADGRVAACAGVLGTGSGRGMAWALLGDGGAGQFLALHRAAAAGLAGLGYRRIEAQVSPSFQQGRRWAEMLGFQLEGVMRSYLDDDEMPGLVPDEEVRDVLLYARVTP